MSMQITSQTPMTMEQASTFTGYSIKYLYKLVHDGTIPYYKPDNTVKGKVIFCKEELTEWIFRNRRASNSELNERATVKLAGGAK